MNFVTPKSEAQRERLFNKPATDCDTFLTFQKSKKKLESLGKAYTVMFYPLSLMLTCF
jgi:hypothetical protein